jgi:cytochrome c-type biogenesis protein CcmH/NrfG
MLFEKIRRTQKPVFIVLALMFGMGFVFLGVGSGTGGMNPLDIFTNGGGSGSGISDLSSKVKDNPKDATSWLALARAYQTNSQLTSALGAYQAYLSLKPKDPNVLIEAASLYDTYAAQQTQSAAGAQAKLQALQAMQSGTAVSGLKFANQFSPSLLVQMEAPYQTQVSQVQAQARGSLSQAASLWQRAADLQPTDSTLWRALAQDALQTQNYAGAVKAIKQVIKLEPGSQDHKQLVAYLKQLEPLAKSSQGAGSQPITPTSP